MFMPWLMISSLTDMGAARVPGRLMREKRAQPDLYREFLLAGGGFHQFGHFMFGGNESFPARMATTTHPRGAAYLN